MDFFMTVGNVVGPNEIITFEVRLVNISDVGTSGGGEERFDFKDIDLNHDGLLSRDEVVTF